MLTIVGLGNPGKEYAKNRHNAGFMALDRFVTTLWPDQSWQSKSNYLYQINEVEGVKVALIKPQTYMNRSGEAVGEFLKFHDETAAEKLWVVYDDVNVDLGSIRSREEGSSGGHNGVESIIQQLGDGNFSRLRIGIKSANQPVHDLTDYVLKDFTPTERNILSRVLDALTDYMIASIRQGKLKDETIHV